MATPLLILYGSQTGNAQDAAESAGREAAALGFAPRVLAMDAYPTDQLPTERAAVFFVSTTGQGDAPDNMRRAWRFLLRRGLAADALAGTKYAVFGLGDSGYAKYNVAAKKLDRRLAALGAAPLLERGLGDDQASGGYEAALRPWLEALWAALCAAFPPPPGAPPRPALDAEARLRLGPPKYRVTLLPPPSGDNHDVNGGESSNGGGCDGAASDEDEETRLQREAVAAAAAFHSVAAEASGMPPQPQPPGEQQQQQQSAYGPWRPYMAPLLVNRRITSADHFQDTRHLEFGLGAGGAGGGSGSGQNGLEYEPGDLLAIFPRTPEADVQRALARLGLAPEQRLRIEAASAASGAGGGGAAAVVATARALVQGVLDLSGAPPRRYLFQVLRRYATVEREAERLAYFASPEGRDDLYDYNNRERRTLLEVLLDFPSAAPLPLERLLEAAPILQPRYFSISSAPLAHPGRAHVTAAVVRYSTPFKRHKRGLVTNWLAGLQAPLTDGAGGANGAAAAPLPRVPVWVERGSLRMPPTRAAPLLLIGPGTGVAPFRSFLWQRAAWLRQAQQQQQEPAPAPCVLFFGCRHPRRDFYYADEWAALQRAGALDAEWGLVAAFSRPDPVPAAAADGGGGAPAANGVAGEAAETAAAAAAGSAAAAGGGKRYVTDALKEHGARVWRLLAVEGGGVFVSGSAKRMPADVAAALEAVARAHGGLDAAAAAAWLRSLEAAGRYRVEAWS